MTGSRKYRFALWGLLSLVVGYAASVWGPHVAPGLFSEFAWGVVGIVFAFGVPNAGEHFAQAWSARKGGEK